MKIKRETYFFRDNKKFRKWDNLIIKPTEAQTLDEQVLIVSEKAFGLNI